VEAVVEVALTSWGGMSVTAMLQQVSAPDHPDIGAEWRDGNLRCVRYGIVSRLLPNSCSWIPRCHFAKMKAIENHRVGEAQLKTTV